MHITPVSPTRMYRETEKEKNKIKNTNLVHPSPSPLPQTSHTSIVYLLFCFVFSLLEPVSFGVFFKSFCWDSARPKVAGFPGKEKTTRRSVRGGEGGGLLEKQTFGFRRFSSRPPPPPPPLPPSSPTPPHPPLMALLVWRW